MTGPPPALPALAAALARTHSWFEANSGWAPPDPETLVDWAAEAACRAPDECWVNLRGICEHGLVSWQVVLDDLAALDDRGNGQGASRGPGVHRLRLTPPDGAEPQR